MSEASVIGRPMKAVVAERPGGPEILRLVERPVPRPGCGELLIKVAAAGLNGADLLQRAGRYPAVPGMGDVLGLEASGEIAALGEGVAGWQIGDRVGALLVGGGYAEYCTVPAVQCLPLPPSLTTVEGAAFPEVTMTVWANVFEHGELKPGETLLVHGGSSGIGTLAIQLATALGSKVLATAGSAEKCRCCTALGAARAINYREEDFVEVARRETRGTGADVILDMVGGSYLQRGLDLLAPGGRLVMIALKEGRRVELDCAVIQSKNLTLTGSTLRPRPVAEKGRLVAAVRKSAWPLVAAGRIRPVIDSTFPLAEAAAAHAHMASSRHIGKILLTMG